MVNIDLWERCKCRTFLENDFNRNWSFKISFHTLRISSIK